MDSQKHTTKSPGKKARRQNKKKKRTSGRMGLPTLRCSKCGKELPEKNYAICPSCGATYIRFIFFNLPKERKA
jgi:rubrerythrin